MSELTLEIDNYSLGQFIELARGFNSGQFAFVVTPNTDHIIRYDDDSSFRDLYREAKYVLLDSRFLSLLFRVTHGLNTQVCPGSDLTSNLFTRVIRPDDLIVVVGSTTEQIDQLRSHYKLSNLQHHNPPMGFTKDPAALEACLKFVEQNSPFRFCLIAVGCPQQELVAQQLKARGIACGLSLCIGASINFLTGQERRAPSWMQKLGCEWLYRLAQDPRRLAKRYLVRGPRIFGLLRRIRIVIRPNPASN